MTANQGVALCDDLNSLGSSSRGPMLLEDFVLREKNRFEQRLSMENEKQ